MFTTSNMQLLYFIEIHVSKADASLSSGLWRPPSIPSLHVYSNVRASINFLINARRPSSYHFHTPTISQYFPLSISSSYHSQNYAHIISTTHHFSIFSSYHSPTFLISSYHSQYQPHVISTTPTFLKIILINHALSNLHWAEG